MGKAKRPLRDVSRLSGKPLSETLIPSSLFAAAPDLTSKTNEPLPEAWVTSPDLFEYNLPYTAGDIQDTAVFLLANPNISSSVLFRADILADSEGNSRARALGPETQSQTNQDQDQVNELRRLEHRIGNVQFLPARVVPGFELSRTLVRRLIPRNAQLDQPLNQTCHIYLYGGAASHLASPSKSVLEQKPSRSGFLVIYTPHVTKEEDIPYYHPNLRSIALLYEYEYENKDPSHPSSPDFKELEAQTGMLEQEENLRGRGTMSIHFLPFQNTTSLIEPSLGRKLSNLIEVQIRITRGRLGSASNKPTTESPYAAIKDSVIPRARVQDTYSRLKTKYAADLTERWVESTEPSKHVFEDLGVAAFLVELWRDIYGVAPRDESEAKGSDLSSPATNRNEHKQFPGFVDIACGNGVLVYILLSEGYSGWGFDARRRRTWSILPDHVQERLREDTYIPRPFADVLSGPGQEEEQKQNNQAHPELESKLQKDTFIISNHADELTLWTPLLATYLNPENPPPFLAIPCCSHSLSGARYRYSPQKHEKLGQSISTSDSRTSTSINDKASKQEANPDNEKTGDLAQMRAAKLAAQNPHSASFGTSTYGALTDKLIALSTEVNFDVVKTLLRIPSTRNIGVLGNCSPRRVRQGLNPTGNEEDKGWISPDEERDKGEVLSHVAAIVTRECAKDGGVLAAARIWIERAEKLKMKIPKGHNHGLS